MPALTTYHGAIESRNTAPVRVVWLGDSRVDQFGASAIGRGWQTLVADMIRSAFPLTAPAPTYAPRNYVPLVRLSGTPASEWTSVSVASTPNNFGPGSRVAILSAAGQGGNLTFNGTSCEILWTHPNVAGSFQYRIDNGPWTTKSWSDTAVSDGMRESGGILSGLTLGSHTLEVRWVSGTVYLEGAVVFAGEETRGFQFYDAGRSGVNSANYMGAHIDYFGQWLADMNPHLLLVNLLTNDHGVTTGQTPVATYKANLEALIAKARAVCTTNPNIILVKEWERGGVTPTIPIADYWAAQQQIADADSMIFTWDLANTFGATKDADHADDYIMADLTHETDAGQLRRATLLKEFLALPVVVTPTPTKVVSQKIRNNKQWRDYGAVVPVEETDPANPLVGVPYLSHDVPTLETRLASVHKSFAHYFPTDVGPISLNNSTTLATDYQQVWWMPPGAFEGEGTSWGTDYRPVGGLTRDRPIWRPALPGTQAEWMQADRRTDVQRMFDAGLDGCVLDVLGLTGSGGWTKVMGIYDAVAELGLTGKFVCWLMLDWTGGPNSATVATIASHIATAAAKPAQFRDGGRVQVSFFAAEVKTLQFYTDLRAALKNTHGLDVDFTMCYVDTPFSTNCVPKLNAEAKYHGRWGTRNPVNTGEAGITNRGFSQYLWDTYGKHAFKDVSPGDVRANIRAGNNWNEQRGLEQFRTSWDVAIRGNNTANGKARWTQVITWNDWSETAMICPSRNLGWSAVDLNWYYTSWWKTGQAPTIVRDCLYLAHKTQFATGMTWRNPTGRFDNPMELVGGTPAWDYVEVTAMVKDPVNTTIDIITSAGVTTKTGLAPGLNVLSVPLAPGGPGSIRAVMRRGGVTVPGTSITSPWAASHTADVHDPSWRIGSSLRGWSATYPMEIPAQGGIPIT